MTTEENKAKGKEARLHERYELAQALRFHLGDEASPTFWTGLARNISSGGLFVNTYNIPAIGASVDVRFKLPGAAEALRLQAEVVWTRDEKVADDPNHVGFGARFLGLTREAEAALNLYLKKIETIFHDVD
jgi:uncharacterized protein (TIGR02266 family)